MDARRAPRGGEAQGSLSAGAAKSVPRSLLLLNVSVLLCISVSRLPQRRDRVPSRCGLRAKAARRVKAAQEGRGAEGARSSWP